MTKTLTSIDIEQAIADAQEARGTYLRIAQDATDAQARLVANEEVRYLETVTLPELYAVQAEIQQAEHAAAADRLADNAKLGLAATGTQLIDAIEEAKATIADVIAKAQAHNYAVKAYRSEAQTLVGGDGHPRIRVERHNVYVDGKALKEEGAAILGELSGALAELARSLGVDGAADSIRGLHRISGPIHLNFTGDTNSKETK